MPFNGAGIWQRLYNFVADRDAAIKILASRVDGEFNNVGSAINEIVSGDRAFIGPIKVAYGTAAAPGIQFEGDNNTGVYRSAADEVGITTNGVVRVKIGNTEAEFTTAIGFKGGTLALPGLHVNTDVNTGIASLGTNSISIVTGGTARQEFDTTSASFTVPIYETLGSVTAPSYSFTGDTNTGIYSQGANQVSVATDGVQRLNIATVGITSTLPFFVPGGTAALPAYSFAGDTNTGIYSGASDSVSISSGGSQKVAVTSFGTSVFGGLISDDFLRANQNLIVVGTSQFQDAVTCLSTLNAFNLFRDGSQVYSRNNILGTVSQSGGVPTGAVIQSGSNANGSFTRWADGTMICNHSIVASAGATSTWTFPSTFTGTPEVSANPNSASARMGTTFSPSTTNCNFDIWDITGTRQANTARLTAIGRWF